MTSSIVRGFEVMESSTSGLFLARVRSTSALSSPLKLCSSALSLLAILPALHLLPEVESRSQGTSGRRLPHPLSCRSTHALLLNPLPHRVQEKVVVTPAWTPLVCCSRPLWWPKVFVHNLHFQSFAPL